MQPLSPNQRPRQAVLPLHHARQVDASPSARPAPPAAPRRTGRAPAPARTGSAPPPGPRPPPPRCPTRPRPRCRPACPARATRSRAAPAPAPRPAWRSPAPRARSSHRRPGAPAAAASPAAPRRSGCPRRSRPIHRPPAPPSPPHPASPAPARCPSPSRQFEQGQCATPVPDRAKSSISDRIQLHAMRVPDVVARPAQILGILPRTAAELRQANRRYPRHSRPDGCAASPPCRAPAAPPRASGRG